jgi:DUF2946 family protein
MRRNWRSYASAFALVGLAFRLLIAAVHVPPAVAAGPEAASLFSQTILCTASGYRVVQLDAAGQPVDQDQAPPLDAGSSCPVCMTLSAAPLAPLPSTIAVPPPPIAMAVQPVLYAEPELGRKPLVTRGRDPPVQV